MENKDTDFIELYAAGRIADVHRLVNKKQIGQYDHVIRLHCGDHSEIFLISDNTYNSSVEIKIIQDDRLLRLTLTPMELYILNTEIEKLMSKLIQHPDDQS